MANIYVQIAANGGSDSNTGTIASPFLTIAHAAGAASSGDTIIVGAGTFDEGTTQVNLAGTGSGGINLIGQGIDVTIIKSQIDAVAQNKACVLPGSGSDVSQLTIQGTLNDGTFQTPFGSLSPDAVYTNARLHDAKLLGNSDGTNNQAGCVVLLERVVITTAFDANTAASGVQIEMRNCTVTVNGPAAAGVANRADGCFCAVSGRMVAIDTTFTATQDATATGPALGISTTQAANATLIGCTLTTSNAGSGIAADIQRSGASVCRVDPSTVYTTTNGAPTANPATLVPHAGSVHPGATVTGVDTLGTLTASSIATHINYDNAISLTSFATAGNVWTAVVPLTTPVGKYSARVTDGTSIYYVGSITVAAPSSAGNSVSALMLTDVLEP